MQPCTVQNNYILCLCITIDHQVIEYDKFDSMEKAYNEMKEMNQKKTEELEKSIEQRVEKIQQEFDK